MRIINGNGQCRHDWESHSIDTVAGWVKMSLFVILCCRFSWTTPQTVRLYIEYELMWRIRWYYFRRPSSMWTRQRSLSEPAFTVSTKHWRSDCLNLKNTSKWTLKTPARRLNQMRLEKTFALRSSKRMNLHSICHQRRNIRSDVVALCGEHIGDPIGSNTNFPEWPGHLKRRSPSSNHIHLAFINWSEIEYLRRWPLL